MPESPDPARPSPAGPDAHEFWRKLWARLGIASLLVIVALVLWFQIHAVLLTFAGILLAVFLYVPSAWLARKTGMPYHAALTAFCFVLLALFGLSVWLMEARIAQQVGVLSEQLPRALDRLVKYVESLQGGRWIIQQIRGQWQRIDGQQLVSTGLGYLSGAGSVLAELLVVVFVGLFGAIHPQLYVRGAIRLVPLRYRDRARDVSQALGDVMWWWLIGQLISTAFIGVLTAVIVWLLGVPLGLTLAIIAALSNFIPNFGPILAAIPAVMLALLQGPATALWIAAAYTGIQLLQNHVVTPVVQQQTVHLPPVVLVMAQVFMYYWAGLLGLILAPALAAATMKLIQMLYVRDYLNDPMNKADGFWP